MINTIILLLLIFSSTLFAKTERISLKNDTLPAIDLIYNGRQIDSEEAFSLSQSESAYFLSHLNPVEDLFWKKTITKQVDNILIDQSRPVEFKAEIGSYSKILRINVAQVNNGKISNYILYFDKFLHAAFLRTHLLRKLGYIVPRIKYLKKIQITFKSLFEKKYFINSQLKTKTEGAPTRWIDEGEINDDSLLTITVKDIAVFQKQKRDFKNLALAPTKESAARRVIRSLIVPYALVGLRESVNGFSWTMGQIKNQALSLTHILEHASFNASIDDIRWSLNKIKKLKRSDFVEIVQKSHFPEGVDLVLVEKIISRRNVILKKLKIASKPIKVNYKVNYKNAATKKVIVKKGRIIKLSWDNYASNFAYKKKSTPFDEYQYFIYSKLRSTVMENLLTKYNEYFKFFNITDQQIKFHRNQFKQGLERFIKTGEFTSFPIKTWNSPFFNTSLIVNRDVIVGNYMGSDNMVQLADTVGASVDLGIHFGVENLGSSLTGFFQFGTNIYKTYTHLRPVISLKAAYKIPITKIFDQSGKYEESLLELSKGVEAKDPDKIKLALEVLKKNLKRGESLIITESVAPRFMLGGSYTLTDLILSPSIGTSYAVIKRTQLFRKDENTIQVYSDKGQSWDIFFGVKVSSTVLGGVIPILNYKAKRSQGKYKINLFDINLDADLETNPELGKNAFALYSLLKNNSTELLEYEQKPVVIKNKFIDKAQNLSFLFFSYKALNTQGEIEVTPREGKKMTFINLSQYDQTGINKEVVVRDSINYYLKKYIKDYPVEVAVSRTRNAGYSIGGKSHTFSAQLQVKVEGEQSKYDVLALVERREGWSYKRKKLEKLIRKINKRYGKTLFDVEAVKNLKKLRLYDIAAHINLYTDGLKKIWSIPDSEFVAMKKRYMVTQKCHRIKNVRCEKLPSLSRKLNRCRKKKTVLDKNKCILNFTNTLFKSIDIIDFKRLVGVDNYYMFGSINGFRTESEVLNDTIYSDSEGMVGDVFFRGPLDAIMQILGVSSGEFNGWWLREKM